MNPTPRTNQLWLILLAGFWAFYGLIGRDAWKDEEALALGTVLHWVQGSGSVWSGPAPLFSLVAGLTAQLGAGFWDLQDGARLASGVFTLTALSFTGMAARALFGPGYGAAAVLALMGALGLMLRAHALLPETALLATWSLLMYGLVAGREHPRRGAVALGLALALLTLGLRGLVDLALGLGIVLMSLASPAWRNRTYQRAVIQGTVLAAGLILLGLAWLGASGQGSTWLAEHGLDRVLGLRAPGSAYSELPWFTWPLWPLAAWAVWHVHRRLLRTPELHPPLILLAGLLIGALVPAWSRDGALLPVLLPLALLAAFALEHLRRGAAQAFYWFGVMFFLTLVPAFWVYFSALEWGQPMGLAAHMARLTPNYDIGSVSTGAMGLAGLATLAWLLVIPLFPRAKTRPVLVWATGMVLTWILVTALFRPWAEAGWGYRPLIMEMARHLPAQSCLKVQVDPAMAIMLQHHLKRGGDRECAWTLRALDRQAAKTVPAPEAGVTVVWEGKRPRSKHPVYRLEKHGDT